MWERFGFYCLLGLLALYMKAPEDKGGLAFDTVLAGQIYGLYNGFVYFTPFFGGLLADRYLGYRRAIFLGGIFMMLGYFCLTFVPLPFFFLGLSCVILGNGLFKPNISTMVG